MQGQVRAGGWDHHQAEVEAILPCSSGVRLWGEEGRQICNVTIQDTTRVLGKVAGHLQAACHQIEDRLHLSKDLGHLSAP